MNDLSATRIIRWLVSVPLSLFTALTAVLWAWPKSGEGGFTWMLSLPIGLGFVYLTHRLTAPPRAPRSVWVPIALTAGLTALTFGGFLLATMVLPADAPSDLSMTMVALTFLWPWLTALALIVEAVLKFVDYLVRRSSERAESQAAALAAQPAMPTPTGTAPLGHAGTAEAAPSPSMISPSRAPEEFAVSVTALATGADAFTDASFLKLSTLVEVAASLEETANSTLMLLSFSSDGVEVSVSGTELGTVEGRWSGSETVRTLQSARVLLEELALLTPAPTTLTLRPPSSEDEDLELVADTEQKVAVEAVRA